MDARERIAKSKHPSVPEAGKTKSDVLSEKEKNLGSISIEILGAGDCTGSKRLTLPSHPPPPRVLAIRCPFLDDNNPLLSRSTQRNGEKVSIELILGLVGASPISRITSIRGKNEKKQI